MTNHNLSSFLSFHLEECDCDRHDDSGQSSRNCVLCRMHIHPCLLHPLECDPNQECLLHYKQGNHSVERASGEAARGAARNQVVRSAVKEAATNLVYKLT